MFKRFVDVNRIQIFISCNKDHRIGNIRYSKNALKCVSSQMKAPLAKERKVVISELKAFKSVINYCILLSTATACWKHKLLSITVKLLMTMLLG